MLRLACSVLLIAAAVFAGASRVTADGTRFWHTATLADFLKGEADRLAIDAYGRLILGPDLAPVADANAPVLWSVVAGPGGTFYAGVGNDGQVIRIAADGRTEVVFDAAELQVHALAVGPGGVLYAGTSPEGKVYRIDGPGRSTIAFDPDDKYIWALAFDTAGVLHVATGEKGLVYRVGAEGTGAPIFRARATHARALAFDAAGALIVGTESPGRVFRVQPGGSAFLLLDTKLDEVSALRVGGDGAMYVAALAGRPMAADRPQLPAAPAEPPASAAPVASVSTEITAMAIVDVPPQAATAGPVAREDRRGVRGSLFRIAADGEWDLLWQSSDDAPHDIGLETGGGIVLATGNAGKLLRLAGDPAQPTLVGRVPARQATVLLRDGSGALVVGSSNPGKVFRLSATTAPRGTYESEVRDAESVATWGAISWRATTPDGAAVQFFTRTGNTPTPDDTWSAWAGPYRRAGGEQVTSPKARYLQWKVELAASGATAPAVSSVSVAYLPRNQRPTITNVTVHPPGVAFQKPFASGDPEIAGFDGMTVDRRAAAAAGVGASGPAQPTSGRRLYQRGLQSVSWKADDPNGDDLVFDVYVRREGETAWRMLRKGLPDSLLTWDATAMPGGRYVVKVVASDAPSRPDGAALTAEQESAAFDVDHVPPVIQMTGSRRDGTRTIVAFTVRDAGSPVQRVEYSVDAERWRLAYPRDGMADAAAEEFEVAIDGDVAGRSLVVRATDAAGNTAAERLR